MKPQPAHNRSEKTGRIIILCLLFAGIGLLTLAVLSSIELVQLHAFGQETNGHVIRQEIEEEEVERYEDGKEYTEDIESYYAVVSYTTNQGRFTIRSYDSGTNAPLYPTGSQVTVMYPPGQPEKARIQQEISGFRGIFGPLMLAVFGAALVGTSKLLKILNF
jgi:hypothetical protein